MEIRLSHTHIFVVSGALFVSCMILDIFFGELVTDDIVDYIRKHYVTVGRVALGILVSWGIFIFATRLAMGERIVARLATAPPQPALQPAPQPPPQPAPPCAYVTPTCRIWPQGS